MEAESFAEVRAAVTSALAALEHGGGAGGCLRLACCANDELACDHTLRRFLQAREWDVGQATAMLVSYFVWREANPGCKDFDLGTIQTSLDAKKVFMLTEPDRTGRPILVVVATRHLVAEVSLEESVRFVQYCTDKIMHAAMDDTKGVNKMCVFCDLRKVGMHCLDTEALSTMLDLMNNYYPERLGTAILWKPPTIFWIAWKLIHSFVPKETRRRMCFAYKPRDVAKFMDPTHVPRMLGGTANDASLIPIEKA